MAVSFQLPVGALDTLSYVGPPKFDFFLFRTTWEEGLVTGKIHNLSVRSWLSLQKHQKTPISLSGHQLLWGKKTILTTNFGGKNRSREPVKIRSEASNGTDLSF